MRLLQREQNEEESLEVMKNRWEEWEEKARKRLKDGEENSRFTKKNWIEPRRACKSFYRKRTGKKGSSKRYSDSVRFSKSRKRKTDSL